MKTDSKQIKPFYFENKPFMPYPLRTPRNYKPLLVLTNNNIVYDVIQIDNGFQMEFINEPKRIHLMPEEIKGWWYI